MQMSALAVSGEVSLSFQDELAATIHRAFEVAVEIAVVEVSKLVSQALGDVRDQMQETLRENTFLKTRLQSAELQLGTVRKGRKSKSTNTGGGGSDDHHDEKDDDDGDDDDDDRLQKEFCQSKAKCESRATGTADSPGVQDSQDMSRYDSERQDESFCEIREDGSVRSRDFCSASSVHCRDQKSGLPHESLIPESQQMAQHSQDIHGDQNAPSVEQPVCKKEENLEAPLDDASGEDDGDDERNPDEDADDIRPSCSFKSSHDDEFESDRLSLVQCKLLEDWRPDPEAPQNNQSETVNAGPSRILDVPDMISVPVGGNLGFPASFDPLYQSVGRTHLVHPAPQNDEVQMRTSVPTRMHQCKICGHSFSRASDLRRHHSHRHRVRTASAAKAGSAGRPVKQQLFPPGCSPYHCSECGRDFNRMENLKTHLRIHTGERPYSCSVCGVRFRHSGALTRHFRIHTGEKPYVCGQCGKRFRNCGGLRFHQKSHTVDRHMVLNCV